MPARGYNATDLARTVNSGIPNDVIFMISFSASAAGRAFILTGAYNKMSSSSETESTASDMSDLSYEQELGEVGEGGHGDRSRRRPLATTL
jgi:hypothetical protein